MAGSGSDGAGPMPAGKPEPGVAPRSFDEARGVAAAFTDRRGVVVGFDDHAGSGTVVDETTGEKWWFHCTRIADGSRTVPVGAAVRFGVDLGPTGFEAIDITVSTHT